MEYTKKVMEHFACPQNIGAMSDYDALGGYGDPSCGDAIMMFIKVKDNRIEDISYLVYGCCAAIATSSMTSVLAKGRTLEEAEEISSEDIAAALGGLPLTKMHCSNMGAHALHSVIKNYKNSIKKGDNNENCNTNK